MRVQAREPGASWVESATAAERLRLATMSTTCMAERRSSVPVVSCGDVGVVDAVVVLLATVRDDSAPAPALWTVLLLPFLLTVVGPSIKSSSYDVCLIPRQLSV